MNGLIWCGITYFFDGINIEIDGESGSFLLLFGLAIRRDIDDTAAQS